MKFSKTRKLLFAVIIILLSILFFIWIGGLLHEDTREEEIPLTAVSQEEDIPLTAEAYLQKAEDRMLAQMFEEAWGSYRVAVIYAYIDGDSVRLLQALKGQADCGLRIGALDSCVIRYEQAVELARGLKNDSAEYDIYNQLIQVYSIKMDMENVMKLTQKRDSMESACHNSMIVLYRLERLSREALLQRNVQLAEQYMKVAEAKIDSMPPAEQQAAKLYVYAMIRNHYMNTNELEKARKYSELFINAGKSGFGRQTFSYMPTYYAETIICARQHDQKAAFEALDSMKYGLALTEKDSPRNWMIYHNLKGQVHELFGEWKKASEAYWEALHAARGTYIENGPEFCQTVRQLGWTLFHLKDYDEAMRCYTFYADFCKYQYGAESQMYSDALSALAELEKIRGNVKEGKQLYGEAVDICMSLVKEQLGYTSILERDAFWLSFAPKIWNMAAYAVNTNDQQSLFTEKCYNALLFSKSLLLESDRSMAEAINTECTPQEQRLYLNMQAAQNQLKLLMNNYETKKDKIDSLHQKISALSRQLVPIISKLGYTSFLNQGYENIIALLKEDEVVIDFTDFITDKREHLHAAFIIKKDQPHPKLIKTFTEEDINRLLERKPDNLPTYFLYNENFGEEAYNLIWKPLANEIKGAKTVYYVPSGMMHRIALEALLLKDSTRLGDHYDFVRLTSAREIAKLKNRSTGTKHATAALYGALKYDMDTTTMSKEASRYKVPSLLALNRGESARGKEGFEELPNAKEELNRIVNVLTKEGANVKVRTGTKGTEESFLALSGKRTDILHIATHGFFYTPEQAKDVTYLKGFNDAMQLSGLIMSGGNLAWTGKKVPKGVLGGVLTASSIASMDLRGTDLVVLSACQTGLGIATPEGLYGIQRAFKKAGVQTMVLTLWSVDDEAAKDFMIKFYEELANNKWNKREAFDSAKAYVRTRTYVRNGKKYKDDPYFWAGFVMLD